MFELSLAAYTHHKALAQGCVAVRQMGGINPLSTSGYTLPQGEIQIGASYRYFHSFRHFVGTDEKDDAAFADYSVSLNYSYRLGKIF